jgi:hypothetical protein
MIVFLPTAKDQFTDIGQFNFLFKQRLWKPDSDVNARYCEIFGAGGEIAGLNSRDNLINFCLSFIYYFGQLTAAHEDKP